VWWKYKITPNQSHLFHNDRWVGTYFHYDGLYRPWNAALQQWGKPCPPPVRPPAYDNPPLNIVSDLPTGVDLDRCSGKESYKINGCEVSAADAHDAVGKGGLTDDSKKPWLVIIGPDAASRKRVLDDIDAHPALKGVKDTWIVKAYDPAHWHLGVGFKTDGKPSIYAMSAPINGKANVLHRQDDYNGGPDALAYALRKTDPNYDPSKDPDLRKPSPLVPVPLPAGGSGLPVWVLGGLLLLGFILWRKR
jgi:hypothetical protein